MAEYIGNRKVANTKFIKISKAIVRVAELPNVSLTLSKNNVDIQSKIVGETGIVEFDVTELGTYKITASGTDITTWNKEFEVSELNTIIVVKGAILNNYTKEQWHQASQLGIAHLMFSPKNTWIYVSANSIFNNHKFMITGFERVGNKDQIMWVDTNKLATTYNINPYIARVPSASATSWSTGRYSYGGMKYCHMEQRMKALGDEVYTQATGILPDNYTGTLTTGIKFSELVYSDTKQRCNIYNYSSSADTMTLLSAMLTSVPSNTSIMMIKGYFKSVGTLDETTFNNGVYYTLTQSGSGSSAANIYTKATTYDSTVTYYGLYENMQEDGVFLDGLSDLKPYLVKDERFASAGGTQTTKVSSFSDYVNLPAVEEITGLNRDYILLNGSKATSANAYNITGEGTKLDGFDFTTQPIESVYWTRSACSTIGSSFCNIAAYGYISSYEVNINSYGVRVIFTTN